MQIQLNQLISQTLEELKKLGMKKSTIKSYQYSAYSPIRNYCIQHGTICYEPATLDAFLSSQKKRLENSEISKRHYRKLRRAVQMLQDLSQYGTLQWDHYSAGSTHKTNEHFSLCLKQFLEAQHVSKGTSANLKSFILQFLCHIERNGHCDFNTLSPMDVKDYLTAAAKTHQGSMGNVLYALALREFGKYLNAVGIEAYVIPSEMIGNFKPFFPYLFTDEELSAFFAAADDMTPHKLSPYRQYIVPVIFRLLYCCGLRPNEVRLIRCADIDLKTGKMYIRDTKVHKDRTVVMSPDMLSLCNKYDARMRTVRKNQDYFFPHRTEPPIPHVGYRASFGNAGKMPAFLIFGEQQRRGYMIFDTITLLGF